MKYYYVYVITFSNDKFYIGKRTSKMEPEKDINYWGSPVTFSYLWEDSSLQKEKHIIKICNTQKEISELESNLILYCWKIYPDLCLNRNASSAFHTEMGQIGGKITAEKYARSFVIKSPNGEIISTKNITKFCEQHGLDVSNIIRVINGKQKHHKGWCLPSTSDKDLKFRTNTIAEKYSKKFIVKSPSGEIIESRNLTKFARTNKLSVSAFSKLIRGELSSHMGWTIPTDEECGKNVKEFNVNEIAKKYIKTFILKSPEGILIEIYNITKFCVEYDLQHSNIICVINGKRNSHKGWTLPLVEQNEIEEIAKIRYEKIARKSSRNFKIKSPTGTIIEDYNVIKFCKTNGLTVNSFTRVLNGTQKSHKGWTLPK